MQGYKKAGIIEPIPRHTVNKLNWIKTIKAKKQRIITYNKDFFIEIFLEAIGLFFVLCTLISKSLSLKSFHKQPKALMPQAPIKKIKYRNISFVVLTSFKLIPQIQGKYSNNIPWGLSYRDAKKNFFIIDIFV